MITTTQPVTPAWQPGRLHQMHSDETLSLLHDVALEGTVGRVAFVVDGSAVIRLVTFIVAEDAVLIRTSPGTALALAVGQRVSVEVDEIEPALHAGWSVIVSGILHCCDDECGHRSAAATVRTWAEGAMSLLMAVPSSRSRATTGPRPMVLVPGD